MRDGSKFAQDDHFDRRAATWNERYVVSASFRSREVALTEMLGSLSVQEGAVALDFGCGSGRLARLLAEEGYKVIGVDRSVAMASAARTFVRSFPSAHVVVGDARLLSLPSFVARFQLVLLVGVLEYVEDVSGMLDALRHCVAPGGRVIVAVPRRRSPTRWIESASLPFVRLVARLCTLSPTMSDRLYRDLQPRRGWSWSWRRAIRRRGFEVMAAASLPMGPRSPRRWFSPNELLLLRSMGVPVK